MFESIVPSFAKPLSAAALAGAFLLGGALPALAAESVVEMQRIRDSGPGPVVGKVQLTDSPEGVKLAISLSELPPGPNRLFLHEAGDCSVPRGELLAAEPLAVVNVTTNEGGSEPLKTSRVVVGTTLAQMQGRALVVYRGSQLADRGPTLTGQPRLVACGVIK